MTVIQRIRSIGMGADINTYDGGTNVDMIDIHLDRLAPAPLFVWADRLAFPGQTSKTGRFRIWHSSFEGMSDDVMDDLSAESNVVKIDRATNSVLNWELQGRHAEAGGRAPAAIHNVSIVDNDMYYSPTRPSSRVGTPGTRCKTRSSSSGRCRTCCWPGIQLTWPRACRPICPSSSSATFVTRSLLTTLSSSSRTP